MLAWAYLFDYNNRWSDDPDASIQRARQLADKAIALDPDDPDGHVSFALIVQHFGDLIAAKAAVDKALTLNPNYALALNVRGALAVFTGEERKGYPISSGQCVWIPGSASNTCTISAWLIS